MSIICENLATNERLNDNLISLYNSIKYLMNKNEELENKIKNLSNSNSNYTIMAEPIAYQPLFQPFNWNGKYRGVFESSDFQNIEVKSDDGYNGFLIANNTYTITYDSTQSRPYRLGLNGSNIGYLLSQYSGMNNLLRGFFIFTNDGKYYVINRIA